MARDLRYLEGGEVAALVDPQSNADVLAFLHEHAPSCHSDTGDALLDAAAGRAEVLAFSPSFLQCRYVALIAHRTVVALGRGLRTVCFRLPAEARRAALAAGAAPAPEIGDSWVGFELFDPDRPVPDLPYWTRVACAATRP